MNRLKIPTFNMIKFEREMGNGITNPLLMRTVEDYYVVKFLGSEHGPKILINEFVCYKLAKLLGIPIPDAALITIEDSKIELNEKLREIGVKPGLHFGSRFIPKAQTSIQLPLLNLVTNKEDIPSIILFDQFIYNNDRTINPGNLLVNLKSKQLLAIDHSHTFKLGTIWNEIELKKIHEEPLCLVREFHGHNYKLLLKYVNGHNPFNKILQKIKNLRQADIEWCFEQLPDEWELSFHDENALKNFIWYRIENTHSFLSLLKEQCPDWKGGDLFEF